jgi:hypothetical protein
MKTNEALHRVHQALDVLMTPESYLVPLGPGDATFLRSLVDLRERLGTRDDVTTPHEFTVQQLANRWTSQGRNDVYRDLLMPILKGLDAAIAKAIADGGNDERTVHSFDFTDRRMIVLPEAEFDAKGVRVDVPLWVGVIDSLPEGHHLRSVLTPDEFYEIDAAGKKLALTLGRPVPQLFGTGESPPPRAFYLLRECISLTKFLRKRQKQQEVERSRREKEEEEQKRREWWSSPLGQEELRRRELEKLRAAGKIPDLPLFNPAVRLGN